MAQEHEESLDETIAKEIAKCTASQQADLQQGVKPPATWELCSILTDYGLAFSDSTGITARPLGPFWLAIEGSLAQEFRQALSVVVSLTLSQSPRSTLSHQIAALRFGIRALAATLASDCPIKDALEWQVFLLVRRANIQCPPRYPTPDELAREMGIGKAEVLQRIVALQSKHPSWGSRNVPLMVERGDGRLETAA